MTFRRLTRLAETGLIALAVLLIVGSHCLAETWRVVDGDTIRVDGQFVRVVGMDAPESYRPRCEAERTLARKATLRLRELIAGARRRELAYYARRDKYGRRLAILYLDGERVDDVLIREGLARRLLYDRGERRRSWCE